jgi:hypothetical protein
MGKWLAIGGVALLVVLLVLWQQLDSTSATAAPPAPTKASAPIAGITAGMAAPSAKPGAPVAPADVAAPVEPTSDKPEKMDVESDEFFYKFQEVVPAVLTRKAAECYEGVTKHLHRNQKLVLNFKVKIKDGEVTINDVKQGENTIGNPGLETCFTQAVQRSGWHDDSLPDWEADDQLVIRPERGMKKYMRSNIDYVGAPAPKD